MKRDECSNLQNSKRGEWKESKQMVNHDIMRGNKNFKDSKGTIKAFQLQQISCIVNPANFLDRDHHEEGFLVKQIQIYHKMRG